MRYGHGHAVRPGAFKASWTAERHGSSAHLKVDFDLRPTEFKTALGKTWKKPANPPSKALFVKVARLLKREGIRVACVLGYTTGRGVHLRAWVEPEEGFFKRNAAPGPFKPPPEPTDQTIWELQQLLGDDPIRVEFNRQRIDRGEVGWNVLWTEKWRNFKLVSFEDPSTEWTSYFRQWLGLKHAEPESTNLHHIEAIATTAISKLKLPCAFQWAPKLHGVLGLHRLHGRSCSIVLPRVFPCSSFSDLESTVKRIIAHEAAHCATRHKADHDTEAFNAAVQYHCEILNVEPML